MKGGKAFPLTMELNITNKCNLKCLSCWQRSAKINYDELLDEEWMKMVKEAGRIGVKELRIPGSGEPMMRKDLVLSIMAKASHFGMNTLLITNGTLFDERTIKKMIGKIDNVTFSIDGPDSKINDYLRGRKGTFKRATEAIRKFNFWKRKLKERKPFLRLNVVISNKNYDKLDRLIKLAHDLGCQAVSFQPMTIFSEFGEKLRLNEDQLNEFPEHIRMAIKISKEYGIYTNLDEFMKEEAKKSNEMNDLIEKETKDIEIPFLSSPCFEPWYNMVIMPSGSVGPCSVFGGNGENIKGKTIEEIWFGEYFSEIRVRLISKKLFSFCKNCCVPVFEENRRLRRELMKWQQGII
jgi:MoaA/NifB/PqqE/SkfB family radical SAM enzyme